MSKLREATHKNATHLSARRKARFRRELILSMSRAPTEPVNFHEFSYVRNRKAGSRALRNSSGVVPFWRIHALRKGDRIDLGFLDSTSGKTRREQIKVAHGGCRQVSHTSATDALPPSPRVGGRWRVGSFQLGGREVMSRDILSPAIQLFVITHAR